MLRMGPAGPELAGPCGPDPWYIEVAQDQDPLEVVGRLAGNLMGEPRLVHPHEALSEPRAEALGGVAGEAAELAGIPVGRAELARNSATSAAIAIAHQQVLEHGLRHLAWLVKDDEVVRAQLSSAWKNVLDGYFPEPFRNL